MTPCPLCLLGFREPHTKEDWARLKEPEMADMLDRLLQQRHDQLLEAYAQKIFVEERARHLQWTTLPDGVKQYYLNRAETEVLGEGFGH